MILSALPSRYSFWASVTESYCFLRGNIPLPSFRDRDTIVTSVTERYMRYKRYKRYRALQNVTCVTESYIRNIRIFENLNKKTN